jgi:hypothetical protein
MTTATSTLRCPECASDNICAQNKAFVAQRISFQDDALTVVYEPFDTDDVEFDDGPEWYVCRDCGEHSETIDRFKVKQLEDHEIVKLAQRTWDADAVDIPVNAKVSRSTEEGAFVSAWVWVDFPEGDN